jgi:hypothetical protein
MSVEASDSTDMRRVHLTDGRRMLKELFVDCGYKAVTKQDFLDTYHRNIKKYLTIRKNFGKINLEEGACECYYSEQEIFSLRNTTYFNSLSVCLQKDLCTQISKNAQ